VSSCKHTLFLSSVAAPARGLLVTQLRAFTGSARAPRPTLAGSIRSAAQRASASKRFSRKIR
jgi:hypothetical protein